MEKKNTLWILTNPMLASNKSAMVSLSKFVSVMREYNKDVCVMGGNISLDDRLADVDVVSLNMKRKKTKLLRILDIAFLQIRMAFNVMLKCSKGQKMFFWIGDKLVLPLLVAKLKGVETNYFVYGNTEKEGKKSFVSVFSGKIIRFMAGKADYICVESKSVVDEWPNLKYKNMRVLHLFTEDISFFSLSDRKRVVGMLCRIAPGKHILECIRAMKKIHNMSPDWKLEVIGSGKQFDECQQLISDLQASEYIHMYGWVDHKDMLDYINKWRYLLFPSDTEGMPNSVIEMMGHGIPVIGSCVGGINDILLDNVNGIKLKNESEEAISEGIKRGIFLKETEYEEMSRKAFDIVETDYSFSGAKQNVIKEFTG